MSLFYLCSRPGNAPAAGVAAQIYNAKWPRFFARVEQVGSALPVTEISYAGANLVFSCGFDGEKPSEYLLIIEDNIDKADYPRLSGPLQEAVAWYMRTAGIERGASRFDYSLLEDYSTATPALQALHFQQLEAFLLSHEKGVNGFGSVEDMDEYMQVILKLSDEVIAHGNINEEGF
ncbi:MAG TPA: hypothetical protein VHS53_04460 [Mucilaginibacter sp.]|jgi:hypothetical protein|nr:hypothetical protein [Mucilaginibacter sp.]